MLMKMLTFSPTLARDMGKEKLIKNPFHQKKENPFPQKKVQLGKNMFQIKGKFQLSLLYFCLSILGWRLTGCK